MKTPARIAIAASVGLGTFLLSAVAIEFLAWYWLSPSDPLSDPATNALRFVAAGGLGLTAGLTAGLSGLKRRRLAAR